MYKGMFLLGVFILGACEPALSLSKPRDFDKGFQKIMKHLSVSTKLQFTSSAKPSKEVVKFVTARKDALDKAFKKAFKTAKTDYKSIISFDCELTNIYTWQAGKKLSDLRKYFNWDSFNVSNTTNSTKYTSSIQDFGTFNGYTVPPSTFFLEVVDPDDKSSKGIPHYIILNTETNNIVTTEVCLSYFK